MLKTTIGQALINDTLPPDLRDYTRSLDKKGVNALLNEVAKRYPDKYVEISKALSDIGAQSSYETGGFSFGIKDLIAPPKAKAFKLKLAAGVKLILDNPRLSDKEKDDLIIKTVGPQGKELEKLIYEGMLDAKSPLAHQVLSGSRGSPGNLRSLVGADLLYEDQRGRPIPIPITHSYGEGLRPAEYFAGAFGTRKGVVDLKSATADAGYMAKQLNQVTHRLVITDHDHEHHDEHSVRGVPVDTDDNDNEGSLLAHPIGGYKRNTVLTPKITAELKAKGFDKILVRSPMVGGPPQGGLYAADVGVRERGVLPPRGENVGIAASSSLSEPLTQAQICLKNGTMVRMGDGTTKAIESIVIGDVVLGARKSGDTFPVKVVNVFSNGTMPCVKTIFVNYNNNNNRSKQYILESTLEHKILAYVGRCETLPLSEQSQPQIVPVGFESKSFSPMLTGPGDDYKRPKFVCLRRSQVSIGDHETFDIEVANIDHLFVLENGLIVSNSSKHTGGVAGAGGAISGFKTIEKLVQVPKTFGGASHAQTDGKVGAIFDAPAGGKYAMINGVKHYISTGLAPKIKSGDRVEAGDVISEGLPNPAEIVKHKGIGEGRRYFADVFRDVYRSAGLTGHRRNIELVSRGLINHIKLNEEMGDYFPGDIVPYDTIEHTYLPREGYEIANPKAALGKYLEKPVLHYSIGTHIKPSMLKNFEQFGVKNLIVHKDPPPFEPEMVRAMDNLSYDPDWQTQMLGSNLKRNLLDSAHRGATSDELGTSFVPALTSGVNFGTKGLTKAWDPKELGQYDK